MVVIYPSILNFTLHTSSKYIQHILVKLSRGEVLYIQDAVITPFENNILIEKGKSMTENIALTNKNNRLIHKLEEMVCLQNLSGNESEDVYDETVKHLKEHMFRNYVSDLYRSRKFGLSESKSLLSLLISAYLLRSISLADIKFEDGKIIDVNIDNITMYKKVHKSTKQQVNRTTYKRRMDSFWKCIES